MSSRVKKKCNSLINISEPNAKVLSKLFPGSYKRKFDPLSECVNSESKRKKKKFKGRPKEITTLLLSDIPATIPKGIARERVRKEGRIKDIPFGKWCSSEEIKELINEVFSGFSSDFIFLEGQKNNSIHVASKQGLDGQGVIDLARHGSLYLKELAKPSPEISVTSPPNSAEDLPTIAATPTAEDLPTTAATPTAEESPSPVPPYLSEENKVLFAKATDIVEKLTVN